MKATFSAITYWSLMAVMGVMMARLNVNPNQWEFWVCVGCVALTRAISSPVGKETKP